MTLLNNWIVFYFKGTYVGGGKIYKNLNHYSYGCYVYIMASWGSARIWLCFCVCMCMYVSIYNCYFYQITLIYLKELIAPSSKDSLSLSPSTKHGVVTNKTVWEKVYEHLENNEIMQNKHSGIIYSKSCWAKLMCLWVFFWQIMKLAYGARTMDNKCLSFNKVVDIVVQVNVYKLSNKFW